MSLFMMFSMTSCMEKVDAGCEGIKVNLYGSDKGVDDASLVTGIVWYNPWTTTVYEYPTYVQTIDYEPFTINAKDGSEFTVDPTVSLKIIDGKSPAVFKKYRKELDEVIEGTMYNYVKEDGTLAYPFYFVDWPTHEQPDEIHGARAINIIAMKKAISILQVFDRDTTTAQTILQR